MSEVDKIRDMVQPFLKGNGVDLGFGGNPVNRTAICIDIAEPYSDYGGARHLTGDASNLYWFKDEVLDYVFSSHLLEDFENTREVLSEWLRVLKPDGTMALYLPDEKRYRDVVGEEKRNKHHKNYGMNLSYMENLFVSLSVKTIYTYEEVSKTEYSFLIVGKKEASK